MTKPDFKITIQNIVASIDLFTSIELVEMYQKLIDNESIDISYYPDKFPGVILKIKTPKVSSLVFSSGKLVLTGAKSTENVRIGVKIISDILRKVGVVITEEPEIVIQNIVASGNFNRQQLNLELIALWLDHTMYEPEQFPGLIFRLQDPKNVLLLFQSGNLVCTGGKSEEQVHEAVAKTYDLLEEINAFDL
ncbi:MAG: TATA-box-binding protein [Candidatus Heimdallarchaeaceae archaeon]